MHALQNTKGFLETESLALLYDTTGQRVRAIPQRRVPCGLACVPHPD